MPEDIKHYGVVGMRWGVRKDRSVARAGRLAKKADRNEKLATAASKMNTASSARAAKRYAKVSSRARNKSERLVPTKYTADKLSKSANDLERAAINIRGNSNIAKRIIGAPAAARYEAKAAKKRDAAMEIMKTVTFERPFNPRTQGDRADRFRSQVSERSGESYSSRPSGGNDRKRSSGSGKALAWGLAGTVATGLAQPTAKRMGEAVAVYVGGKAAANPKIAGKIGEAAVSTLVRSFAKQSDVSMEEALKHLDTKKRGSILENDSLRHYGKKGMKWGKRKQPLENANTKHELAANTLNAVNDVKMWKEVVSQYGRAAVEKELLRMYGPGSKNRPLQRLPKVVLEQLGPGFKVRGGVLYRTNPKTQVGESARLRETKNAKSKVASIKRVKDQTYKQSRMK